MIITTSNFFAANSVEKTVAQSLDERQPTLKDPIGKMSLNYKTWHFVLLANNGFYWTEKTEYLYQNYQKQYLKGVHGIKTSISLDWSWFEN